MIINREKKYIFIHIPRTSGTNLYSCLSGDKYDESGMGHVFARRIKEMHPEEFKSFYKFVIVRNDYTRLHSWWFNRRFLHKSVEVDFPTWLLRHPAKPRDIHRNWDARNRWRTQSQRTSQLEWFTDNRGHIIVDHVIRFENLKSELKKLGKIIGEDFSKMPRHGINNPEDNKNKFDKNIYTPEMIEFIKKVHRRSLKRFGYDL